MKNLTPSEIVALMDKEVSGQDDAKRMLAIALRNRWRIQQLPPELRRSVKKQNVLLAGPTGSGKTALMRVIRDVLGMPVLEIDITGYSETGYQGEEVTDIPKGFGRLEFTVPDWYKKENKPPEGEKEKIPPASKSGAWSFEYDPGDKIILAGHQVNGIPAEIHTYFIRAFFLGMLTLDGTNLLEVDDEAQAKLLPEMFHEFAEDPEGKLDYFDYLQAGVYVMNRNPLVLTADDDTFTRFYMACASSSHMRYDKPFTNGKYEDYVSHLFTNTRPELAGEKGWVHVVQAWKGLGFDDIDALTELPIVRQMVVKKPDEKEEKRIGEIAAAYLMRATFVGMLKEGKLDLPTFVTQRVNTIKIGDELYGFYFEKFASGNFPEIAEEVRRLAAIGYNIMSAKPAASTFGFKMWRKNMQTLPLGTKKTANGPNERICNAYPFFNQFATSDEFTDYAISRMKTYSPTMLSEIFTDQQILDYKPFRFDVNAILEEQQNRLAGFMDNNTFIYGRGGRRGGGDIRDNFINTYGVVFIDEIDKLIGEKGRKSDVSREGVQRSLLKVVEGGEYAGYDTTNILFVAAGAFSGKHPSMLMPELLGRFPLRATLKKLLKEDIARIAQLPNSEFMGAIKLVEIEGVNVLYDEDTFDFIAETVAEINEVEDTGARRIGAVVEYIFSDAYFKPETFLENGYDVRGETLRAKPAMEALVAARATKEAREKLLETMELDDAPEPEVEQKRK